MPLLYEALPTKYFCPYTSQESHSKFFYENFLIQKVLSISVSRGKRRGAKDPGASAFLFGYKHSARRCQVRFCRVAIMRFMTPNG